MGDISDVDFKRQLMAIGIVRYSEQDTLLSIAKRCAVTTGLPVGGASAVMGKSVEAFLAGVLAGTIMCTMANVSMRNEIKKLGTTGQ